MNKVYGIDPGRSSFTVANLEGETRSFPNTEPGYQSCLSWMAQEPAVVVVEGRGNGVARLCVLLRERGYRVKEMNPVTSGNLSAVMTHDKTDETDAANLAKMGALLEANLSDVEDDYQTLALRDLGRELAGIKRDLNKDLNRFHGFLAITYGPAYKKIFPRITTSLAIAFYEAFPSAAKALEAGIEGLSLFFMEHGGRRYGAKAARKRVEAILEILNSQGHFPVDIHIQALCQKIKRLTGRIHLLMEQKGEVVDQINAMAPEETNLLCSMKGVDKTLAAVITAEIGDIRRFKSSRQLASNSGLTPAKHQSGESSFTKTRPRFNRALKWGFTQLAYLRARYDPEAKEYYQRKLREGKKLFQARTALARNQVDIVWSILTRGTPYV